MILPKELFSRLNLVGSVLQCTNKGVGDKWENGVQKTTDLN